MVHSRELFSHYVHPTFFRHGVAIRGRAKGRLSSFYDTILFGNTTFLSDGINTRQINKKMYVPYALLEDGTRVLPTLELRARVREERILLFCPAPKCKAVGGRLLIRAGAKMRPHFYHPTSSKYGGVCKGGEGAKHMACKLWVRDNAANPNFVVNAPCTRCGSACVVFRGEAGATGREEARVGKYLIDVLVTVGEQQFYLEVHHTHACTSEKVSFLTGQPGALVEFHAEDLIEKPIGAAVALRTTHLTRATCARCLGIVSRACCAYPQCPAVNTQGVFLSVASGTQFFCSEHEAYAAELKKQRCGARYLHPITSAWVQCGQKNKKYTMRWRRKRLLCPKHWKYG